ncbi:NUDIX domain-containing protein [Pseudonocardia sp. RS010]|uniref:NUDIX domain-containing protein n=1 Tax=Pseudonocardia sp. RS010 TaxID=3385979 RepID=UPI0039A256C9
MDAGTELIAVFDEAGTVVGAAPRAEVYARSLWHASAGVILRSTDGRRVYVHRRADDKLVMAGLWDCVAGGVVDPGETPLETATRELAEELGVSRVALRLLLATAWESGPGPGVGGTALIGEAGLRCHLFGYEAFSDGPVRHQPSEVAEGRWMTHAGLAALLADPARPFAPDSRVLAEHFLATHP